MEISKKIIISSIPLFFVFCLLETMLFMSLPTEAIIISDGDLIRGPDGIKVYIVNKHGFKRHIFNPEVFNMYGHLKWSNIKEVDQKTLDSYQTSDLYREFNDYRVFSVTEDGKKRHFNMKPLEFIAAGYSWDQIFVINEKENNYYVLDSDIKPAPISVTSLPTPKPTSTPFPTSVATPSPTPTSCQNECGQSELKECSGNGYRICGHYDLDSCLEWSSTSACSQNTACQNGSCVPVCFDGTISGQCSKKTKGKYCDGATTKDNCQSCGCETGFSCQTNGSCQKPHIYPADDLNGLTGPIDVDGLNALVDPVNYEAITSDRIVSLIPPADWSDELKNEWNDNITEIQRIAGEIKGWDWESLRNGDLPKLIQWGQVHNFIKIIYVGTGDSGLEEVPRITVPGINAVYQTLSLMPPHIIQMFEGGGIGGTLYLSNKFSDCFTQAGAGSAPSAAFYIINCPYRYMGRYFVHELGHIVDFIGIRNMKGNDFSLGKTDESVTALREEYERIFRYPQNPSSDYLLRESFANWFRDYVINAEHFRRTMAQDSRTAEKYEFLKTKIFLGKEY